MKLEEKFKKAHSFARNLEILLDKPEPGLIVWWEMLKKNWTALKELMDSHEEARRDATEEFKAAWEAHWGKK